MSDDLVARLEKIEARLDALERKPVAQRMVYPWHDLVARGDTFKCHCDWRDADRIRRSIAANAIARFGKGVVSTKIVSDGVLVIRRK